MHEKYQNVKDLFENKQLHRPLTALEIVMLVEKARGSIYKEIKSLMKFGMLEKIEFRIEGNQQKIIFYKKCK